MVTDMEALEPIVAPGAEVLASGLRAGSDAVLVDSNQNLEDKSAFQNYW